MLMTTISTFAYSNPSSLKPSTQKPLKLSRHTRSILNPTGSFRTTQSLNLERGYGFSGLKPKKLGFSFGRNLGFVLKAENGEGETKGTADEAEREARGQSTMPERFRYLTKEAPDPPVRWPYFIGQ